MNDVEKVLNGSFIVDQTHVEPLLYFIGKYKTDRLATEAAREAFSKDVLQIVHHIKTNEHLAYFMELNKKAVDYINKGLANKRYNLNALFNTVRTMETLEEIYEMNKETFPEMKSGLFHLRLGIKMHIVRLVQFLKNRGKAMSQNGNNSKRLWKGDRPDFKE